MVRVLKYALTTVIVVGLIGLFAVFVLEIPMPWKASAGETPSKTPRRAEIPAVKLVEWFKLTDEALKSLGTAGVPAGVLTRLGTLKEKTFDAEQFRTELSKVLVEDEREQFQKLLLEQARIPSHTLEIPEAVRRSLGIRKGTKDAVVPARAPTLSVPLVLPGSTALDPARIVRVRARFAPAEVKEIADDERDNPSHPTVESKFRELRPGDLVKEGQKLGTFYSVEVGSKKNDLFEAIIQYRLDMVILDRAEKAAGSLPDVFLWNARRNVQTDRSGIIRAKNTLKTWNIAEEDIQAVVKEAEEFNLTEKRKSDAKDADWGDKQDRWAHMVLRSPCNGVIVERNVSRGETVVDNTLNLFTIAQADKLMVLANLPETDLPLLQNLKYSDRKWTVHTIGINAQEGLPGRIDEIGYLIDPSQHTAVIKGYIDNPRQMLTNADGTVVATDQFTLRAGQFVSATVNLPPPTDVVEIPINALVEDGKQSLIFVETDARKNWYAMRRVRVTHRFDNMAYVRTTLLPEDKKPLTAEEKEQGFFPFQPLAPEEKVLATGGVELKAALLEKEARERQAQ